MFLKKKEGLNSSFADYNYSQEPSKKVITPIEAIIEPRPITIISK